MQPVGRRAVPQRFIFFSSAGDDSRAGDASKQAGQEPHKQPNPEDFSGDGEGDEGNDE
jgi:hypothetical protein